MRLDQFHKKNEKEQLELLFSRFGKALSSYGQNQWKINEDISWDLVYKTLYKVIETLPRYSFESEVRFRSFVFKIYINYLKNRIRDDQNKRDNKTEVELKEELLAEEVKGDTILNPKLNDLLILLDELEDWQRILLLMRSQGFSYVEIARYTDKEEKNLKVYYGRLKKNLEKKLTDQLLKVESDEKA